VYTGHRSWSSLKRYTNLRPAVIREKALRLRGATLQENPEACDGGLRATFPPDP
jgi:hypothetical protein